MRVQETIIALSGRVRQSGVNPADLDELEIPLPPLATQRAIVAEIEAEQALVAANRELITRFEQKIQATLARIWGEAQASPPATSSDLSDGSDSSGPQAPPPETDSHRIASPSR